MSHLSLAKQAEDAEVRAFRQLNADKFEDGLYKWSEDFVASIAKDWPHFSGDNLYPVPDPKPDSHQHDAQPMFQAANHRKTLWQGPYGRLRMDLLLYMIAKLEEEQE